MSGLPSDGTDPLDDGLNAPAGNSSHRNESRRVRDHRRFRRRCERKQFKQLGPEGVLRFEFSSRLRHIPDNCFATFPFRQARYYPRLIVLGIQHGRAQTEGLGRVAQGRIQQSDGEFRI